MAFPIATGDGSTTAAPAWRLALRVAVASVALGGLIQAAVFALAAVAESMAGARPTLATALAFLGWSSVACVVVTYARVALRASARGMAAAGASAAILGVAASLAITWAVAAAMAGAPATGAGAALLSGAWKAVEYGALGAVVVLLGRARRGALAHAGVGLAWGVAFGGAFLALVHALVAPLDAGGFASRAVTETLFPIGCALILWWEGRAVA